MQLEEYDSEPTSGIPNTTPCTLDPLRTDGPAALDTHDVPGVAGVSLLQLDLQWTNSSCDVSVFKGDNLIAETTRPFRVPRRGTLGHGLFAAFIIGCDTPVKVHVTPEGIRFETPTGHRLVRDWLRKRGFIKKLAHTLAILLLAFAGVLPAEPDDDDDDADEGQRKHFAV